MKQWQRGACGASLPLFAEGRGNPVGISWCPSVLN